MEQLKKLAVGNVYTSVRQGMMGFVNSCCFLLMEIRIEKYAQYPETVLLVVKPLGKRKLIGIRFLPNDEFLVYEGAVEVKTDMFVQTEIVGGMTVQRSLASCDPEYFEIAKRSVQQSPLIEKLDRAGAL